MNMNRNTINQCQIAIQGLEQIFTPQEISECMSYVTEYGEWLLGLELAIDWLVESNQKISLDNYQEFEKAYKLMNRELDVRLKELRLQADRRAK